MRVTLIILASKKMIEIFKCIPVEFCVVNYRFFCGFLMKKQMFDRFYPSQSEFESLDIKFILVLFL